MTDSAIDDLVRAGTAMSALLDRVTAVQWVAPTPCTKWTVRDVVGHIVGLNLVLVALFDETPMPDRDADHLGSRPASAYRRSTAALQTALSAPGVLHRTHTTSLGVVTGTERVRWRTADLLVHHWDLVQATGIAVEPPTDLVERSFGFVSDQLSAQFRTGRFDDPQPISDDAPIFDRFAAFTGRRVPWRP